MLITVEAFNWKTKEQCRLPDIPTGLRIHSGTVLYGIPIVCGGLNYEVPLSDCYKLKGDDGTWEAVSLFCIFYSLHLNNISKLFFTAEAAYCDHFGTDQSYYIISGE